MPQLGKPHAPIDLAGVQAVAARTNLGLGDAAVKNTGTSSGTVAAGDDSRLVQAGAAYAATALFLATTYR